MFKEMQQAEHAYTKAKKIKQNFKRQQAEFKPNTANSINVWEERNRPLIESAVCN